MTQKTCAKGNPVTLTGMPFAQAVYASPYLFSS